MATVIGGASESVVAIRAAKGWAAEEDSRMGKVYRLLG